MIPSGFLLCAVMMVVTAQPCYDNEGQGDFSTTGLSQTYRTVESLTADFNLQELDTRIMGEPDYETVAGVGTYKLHRELASWRESFTICMTEGAHLAVVETSLEANVLKYLLKEKNIRNNRNESWLVNIGFHSQFSDGYWTSIFGSPMHLVYEEWAKGQPDNFGEIEKCGALNYYGELEDVPCDEYEYPFICEKRLEMKKCDNCPGLE